MWTFEQIGKNARDQRNRHPISLATYRGQAGGACCGSGTLFPGGPCPARAILLGYGMPGVCPVP